MFARRKEIKKNSDTYEEKLRIIYQILTKYSNLNKISAVLIKTTFFYTAQTN